MCSNWSPWQEFETLPCLLLVDVVVLMSSSVETRPLIPCHPPLPTPRLPSSLPRLLTLEHKASKINLTVTEIRHLLPGFCCHPRGHQANSETDCSPALQEMLFSSTNCTWDFASLSLSLSTCSSTFFRKIKKKKKKKRLAQSASRRRSGEVFAAGSKAPLVGWVLCRF